MTGDPTVEYFADGEAAAREWRRRDSTRLRSLLFRVRPEVRASWSAVVSALYRDDEAGPAAHREDFRPLAARGVDRLLEGCDADLRRRAIVAGFVYFECLCAWERTSYHDKISTLALELNRGLADLPGEPVDPPPAEAVLTTSAALLAQSLEFQFATENALFCSCPVDFGRRSGEVARVTAELCGATVTLPEIEPLLRTGVGDEYDAWARSLIAILRENVVATNAFYRFLAESVGPAATAFAEALECGAGAAGGVAPEVENAVTLLRAAVADGVVTEAALAGDVLESEVRAHTSAMERMLAELERPDLAMLRVRSGEAVLMYPFGVPEVVDPFALTEALADAETARVADARLLGLPVRVERDDRTDLWRASPTSGDGQETIYSGVRVLFEQHYLRLESTVPLRFPGIEVTVLLNSLGNHYVRVAVTTDTPVLELTDDAGWRPLAPAGAHLPWSGHDLEQWVQRVTIDVGDEEIAFVERSDPSRVSAAPAFTRFSDLAQRLVEEIPGLLHRCLGAESPVIRAAWPDGVDPTIVHNDLPAHAHVALVLRTVTEVDRAGTETPVRDPARLPQLLGGSLLFLPQRSLSSSLDEWVRFSAVHPRNLLVGTGLAADLIHRQHDVTLVAMLASPDWVRLEYQEMVEFSASLSGMYGAWRSWLGHQESRMRAESGPRSPLEVLRELERVLGQVARTLDHVRSARLIRAAVHRQVLDRLLGSSETSVMEESLNHKVELVERVRTSIDTDLRELSDTAQRRRERRIALLATLFGAFSAAGLFQWINFEYRGDDKGGVLPLVEISAVILLFLALWFSVWLADRVRSWRRARKSRETSRNA